MVHRPAPHPRFTMRDLYVCLFVRMLWPPLRSWSSLEEAPPLLYMSSLLIKGDSSRVRGWGWFIYGLWFRAIEIQVHWTEWVTHHGWLPTHQTAGPGSSWGARPGAGSGPWAESSTCGPPWPPCRPCTAPPPGPGSPPCCCRTGPPAGTAARSCPPRPSDRQTDRQAGRQTGVWNTLHLRGDALNQRLRTGLEGRRTQHDTFGIMSQSERIMRRDEQSGGPRELQTHTGSPGRTTTPSRDMTSHTSTNTRQHAETNTNILINMNTIKHVHNDTADN